MLRSLPAILSIVILVLGPRACCLSTFITQKTNTETSSIKRAKVQERCCCKNHCSQNHDTPSDEKRQCPCEKWHGQINAIVHSILKSLVDQDLPFIIQYVITSHFQVVANLELQGGHEPVGFPRMCASTLLCLISIARC